MIRIETSKRKSPSLSIAPLVDCVFLLLIFFLLTSTYRETKSLQIDLPSSASAAAADKDLIEIEVTPEGTISLNGRDAGIDSLAEQLRIEVRKQGKVPVLLLADRTVSVGQVTEIIDCVREAELDLVSIATKALPVKEGSADE